MATDLRKHVDTITHALLAIKDLCAEPEAVSFEEVRADFERLEAAFNVKATLDALFAYVCERDDAGRVVGSKHANQYLQKKLGLEPKDAYDRLARGRDYYGEPEVEDEPATDLFDYGADDTPEDSAAEAAREEAARAAAREAARAEARRKQEEARRAAERVNAEKQRVIRQELDKLVGDAKGARARLQADALAEAPKRTVKDLRATVRRWVEQENRKHVEPTNPNAGMENRGLHIGGQRADGTCRITIDAVASDSALFKALTDKGLSPNSNLPEGVEDYRTPSQRLYDQFSEILKHYDACEKPTGGGCASVVVSVTLDELAEADPTTKFATNTGIELDAFDLVRLGMDGTSDFVLTVDDVTSMPLNLYRTRRLASLAQRITLLAVQGVCLDRLHRPTHRDGDPPHHVVAAGRRHQHRQPHSAVPDSPPLQQRLQRPQKQHQSHGCGPDNGSSRSKGTRVCNVAVQPCGCGRTFGGESPAKAAPAARSSDRARSGWRCLPTGNPNTTGITCTTKPTGSSAPARAGGAPAMGQGARPVPAVLGAPTWSVAG